MKKLAQRWEGLRRSGREAALEREKDRLRARMHDISEFIKLFKEEFDRIYKRGRNSKTATHAKNQTVTDYRRATGYEALLGYLYLANDWNRLMELVRIGYEGYERERES